MKYAKFKEMIEITPLINEEYKKNLLEESINYSSELLESIIIIVYKNEVKFIDDVKLMKKNKQNKIKQAIKKEEKDEKTKADKEIEFLLNNNF